MKKLLSTAIFIILSVQLYAMNISVNKSIYIDDGDNSGSCSTVNGSIHVGNDCKVSGTCRSVNGSIRIGKNGQIRSLQSVNGSIKIAEDTHVRGSISSVNGSINCKFGTKIEDNIETVNGSITLYGTTVNENITTYNGNISLRKGSTVKNDIIVKDNKSDTNREKPLYIIIGKNCRVKGDIINKEKDIEVVVKIAKHAKVEGEMKNVIIESN